jgi:hypothetical protein
LTSSRSLGSEYFSLGGMIDGGWGIVQKYIQKKVDTDQRE